MLPNAWKPVPAGGLVVIGPREDGGYIVPLKSAQASTLLVSMGLNDDWRFEEDFRRRTNARVVCFDGTVGSQFWRMHFIRAVLKVRPIRALHYFRYRRFFSGHDVCHKQEMIGYGGPNSTGFDDIVRNYPGERMFLKIDIEGSEYRILDSIARNKDRLTAIVIEFHDVDLHRERIDRFISEMDGFKVISVHPNNYGGTNPDGDPIVIEMTIAQADLTVSPSPREKTPVMPPTTSTQPDIALVYG